MILLVPPPSSTPSSSSSSSGPSLTLPLLSELGLHLRQAAQAVLYRDLVVCLPVAGLGAGRPRDNNPSTSAIRRAEGETGEEWRERQRWQAVLR